MTTDKQTTRANALYVQTSSLIHPHTALYDITGWYVNDTGNKKKHITGISLFRASSAAWFNQQR